jgi:hypothetical protein
VVRHGAACVLALLLGLGQSGCISYHVVGEGPGAAAAGVAKSYDEDLAIGDYVWITFADRRTDGMSLTEVRRDAIAGTLDSTGEQMQLQRQQIQRLELRRNNVRGTLVLSIVGGIVLTYLLWFAGGL